MILRMARVDNEETEILEGAWNCAQCREEGIPGSKSRCPNCGDPRNTLLDPSETVYLPDNAPVVTDKAQIKRAMAGPDWNCGECGELNPSTTRICGNCGSRINGKADVQPVITYVSGTAAEGVHLDDPDTADGDRVNAVLQQADSLQVLEDEPVTRPTRTYTGDAPSHGVEGPLYGSGSKTVKQVPRQRRNKRRLLIIGSALAAIVGIIIGCVALFSTSDTTHPVNLKVQSVSWQRQIGVEVNKTITQSGWSVPFNGHVISSHTAISSYTKVLDHYVTATRQVSSQVKTGTKPVKKACGTTVTSLGNGHYSKTTKYCTSNVPTYKTVYTPQPYRSPVYRNQPVYGTFYTYWFTQWVLDHYVTASGTADYPYWPTPVTTGPLQRVGSERTESYTVVLVDTKNSSYTESVPESIWVHLHPSEALKGTETSSGDLRSVTWPTN